LKPRWRAGDLDLLGLILRPLRTSCDIRAISNEKSRNSGLLTLYYKERAGATAPASSFIYIPWLGKKKLSGIWLLSPPHSTRVKPLRAGAESVSGATVIGLSIPFQRK